MNYTKENQANSLKSQFNSLGSEETMPFCTCGERGFFFCGNQIPCVKDNIYICMNCIDNHECSKKKLSFLVNDFCSKLLGVHEVISNSLKKYSEYFSKYIKVITLLEEQKNQPQQYQNQNVSNIFTYYSQLMALSQIKKITQEKIEEYVQGHLVFNLKEMYERTPSQEDIENFYRDIKPQNYQTLVYQFKSLQQYFDQIFSNEREIKRGREESFDDQILGVIFKDYKNEIEEITAEEIQKMKDLELEKVLFALKQKNLQSKLQFDFEIREEDELPLNFLQSTLKTNKECFFYLFKKYEQNQQQLMTLQQKHEENANLLKVENEKLKAIVLELQQKIENLKINNPQN